MPSLATRIMQAGPEAIEEARRVLADGGLVAFPTETVYGLGADATDNAAVARLYAAKQRPSFNPLIVHVADLAAARRIAAFDDTALDLARAFWPGSVTLVLRKVARGAAAMDVGGAVGDLASAGLGTVAIRVPTHPVARDLLAAFAGPVAAPSANRSGGVSPTAAGHVYADLGGHIDLIIDDGAAPIGIESTILACLGDGGDGGGAGRVTLLRLGAVPREAIERHLGYAVASAPPVTGGVAPRAPGMLASHYAPRATLRMDALAALPGEALLAFGPDLPKDAARAAAILNLSPGGLLVEAAANLFAHLRMLDGTGVAAIAVMPIPQDGLGAAINDRLRRAAAPRKA